MRATTCSVPDVSSRGWADPVRTSRAALAVDRFQQQNSAFKSNRISDSFWSGDIASPIEVIEEIAFPRFLRRLDEEITPRGQENPHSTSLLRAASFPEGADG